MQNWEVNPEQEKKCVAPTIRVGGGENGGYEWSILYGLPGGFGQGDEFSPTKETKARVVKPVKSDFRAFIKQVSYDSSESEFCSFENKEVTCEVSDVREDESYLAEKAVYPVYKKTALPPESVWVACSGMLK